MRKLVFLLFVFIWTFGGWWGTTLQAGEVKGYVIDKQTGDPLASVTILLIDIKSMKMLNATETDTAGNFILTDIPAGEYYLKVETVGYKGQRLTLSLGPDESKVFAIRLEFAEVGAEVVISSWQMNETVSKISSISILEGDKLEGETYPCCVQALRKCSGVDMAHVGVFYYEISLRGFNNYYSTAPYIMTDFRHSAMPSMGGNFFQVMPFSPVDIKRIEIIRGPGASLYGSGVDAGVIHFLTRDPMEFPGTTVMVSGGERGLLHGAIRHAGKLGNNFGYKIVVDYQRADDWELNSKDSLDRVVLDSEVRPRDYSVKNFKIYGGLKYQFSPRTYMNLNLGYGRTTANLYTRFSAFRVNPGANSFVQFQLHSGNLFTQAHYSWNYVGDSYFYTSKDLSFKDRSKLFKLQQEYTYFIPDNLGRFIVGYELGAINPETEKTINGRFEDDDALYILGGYAQGAVSVLPKLDVTAALRMDYDNVYEKFNLAPRAGIVLKPYSGHQLRALYTKTFAAFSTLDLFMDIISFKGGSFGPLSMRTMGNFSGFHFLRDTSYSSIAGSDLVAYSLNPQNMGTAQPVGLYLNPVFGQLYQYVANSGQPLPGYTQDETNQILNAINPGNHPVEGFSRGKLGLPQGLNQKYKFINDVSDIPKLEHPSNQTFELGYRGNVQNKLLLSADLYYSKRKNFIAGNQIITPMVFVPNVEDDFRTTLYNAFMNNSDLQNLGFTEQDVQNLVNSLIQVANSDSSLSLENLAQNPVAIVQPRENSGPEHAGEAVATTLNFGEVEYWGLDISAQYYMSDRFTIFGSLSFINKDLFDEKDLKEEGSGLSLAINAPKLKIRLGGGYRVPQGFSVNATLRYSDGFPMISGVFIGEVESYFLVDLGVGYDLSRYIPGLRAEVTAYNALDNVHREFIGAPKIGRMTVARLTYHF